MEMGGDGASPQSDRAFQARHLCRGDQSFSRPDAMTAGKSKPPVVMIHGAFAGPWAWEGFAGKFRAAGYKVHTPALRHHAGEKPPQALGQTSLTDYVADLN